MTTKTKAIYSMTMKRPLTFVSLIPFIISLLTASPALSAEAVVHAILFYSPGCGHCHYVIKEVLPPLFDKYGDQLNIVGVDVTQPSGNILFQAALQHFKLESSGVPFLVIGDTYLIGCVDIPQQFPGLIERYLAQGGVDWPDIPGLAEAIAASRPTQTSPPVETTPTTIATPQVAPPPEEPFLTGGLGATFTQDLPGNSVAVIVLLGMILVVGAAFLYLWRSPAVNSPEELPLSSWSWPVPLLCLIGLAVAGYLAYVETSQVQAVCGPVGDCNAVQQSEYARLFGIVPIGILGMVGYGLILLAWILGHSADQRLASYAVLAQLGMTAFGVLFSIYLTFLEPFVIGATCAWCLTSAIIMTALFWLSLAPARQVLSSLFHGEKYALRRSDSQRSLKSQRS